MSGELDVDERQPKARPAWMRKEVRENFDQGLDLLCSILLRTELTVPRQETPKEGPVPVPLHDIVPDLGRGQDRQRGGSEE